MKQKIQFIPYFILLFAVFSFTSADSLKIDLYHSPDS
jgi:hypothetical protein